MVRGRKKNGEGKGEIGRGTDGGKQKEGKRDGRERRRGRGMD